MKKAPLYFSSITLSLLMIAAALVFSKQTEKAEAQAVTIVPFAGQIATVELCCNGIEFTTTGQYQSVAYGTFIMEWYKMIPVPAAGLGLYSWWSILPGEKVLGSALPGGVCLTVASECSTSIPVVWSVNQMGTTLIGI
jgi:hypothetical protein